MYVFVTVCSCLNTQRPEEGVKMSFSRTLCPFLSGQGLSLYLEYTFSTLGLEARKAPNPPVSSSMGAVVKDVQGTPGFLCGCSAAGTVSYKAISLVPPQNFQQ